MRYLLPFVLLCSSALAQDARIYNVILLDGQNNHNWRGTTPVIRDALESTGRFKVTVATAPPATATAEEWAKFRPDFSKCDAIVSNFTDWGAKNPPQGPWIDELHQYVRNGGGYVKIHAASFEKRDEHLDMIGLSWRSPAAGDRLLFDDAGKLVRIGKGEGKGTSHGKPFEWPVQMRAEQHPIAAGLPKVWMHPTDELWESVRGPAKDVEVIATAQAPSKIHEPVMWTLPFGKGRVFVTLLGHSPEAMKCVGFRTTLARGAEWASTGKVTIPVPADFPTAQKVSEKK